MSLQLAGLVKLHVVNLCGQNFLSLNSVLSICVSMINALSCCYITLRDLLMSYDWAVKQLSSHLSELAPTRSSCAVSPEESVTNHWQKSLSRHSQKHKYFKLKAQNSYIYAFSVDFKQFFSPRMCFIWTFMHWQSFELTYCKFHNFLETVYFSRLPTGSVLWHFILVPFLICET